MFAKLKKVSKCHKLPQKLVNLLLLQHNLHLNHLFDQYVKTDLCCALKICQKTKITPQSLPGELINKHP